MYLEHMYIHPPHFDCVGFLNCVEVSRDVAGILIPRRKKKLYFLSAILAYFILQKICTYIYLKVAHLLLNTTLIITFCLSKGNFIKMSTKRVKFQRGVRTCFNRSL